MGRAGGAGRCTSAYVAGVPLLTHNDADIKIIADLVSVETPAI